MKSIITTIAFLFTAQSFATPASEFKGTYQVIEKCQANNSRLRPLDFMAFEGNIVDIDVDSKNGLLLFTAEHSTVALPFSSDTKLKPIIFEDYYSDADIRVTANTYALRTKGSEWGTCDKGLRPCRHKWDDALGMQVTTDGQLQIEWKVESATGTCTLKLLK
jgi:hypothetical protein